MNKKKKISLIVIITVAIIYILSLPFPLRIFYDFSSIEKLEYNFGKTQVIEITKKILFLPGPKSLWAVKTQKSYNVYTTFKHAISNKKKAILAISTPSSKPLKVKHKSETIEQINPLNIAIKNNNLNKVKALINKGVDINKFDNKKEFNSLLYAIFNEKTDIETIKFLLENGADVTATNEKGFSALTFLANGTDTVNVANKYGAGYSNTIFKKRSLEIVKLLLAHGADVNTLTNGDKFNAGGSKDASALLLSISQKPGIFPKYLIDNNADISIENSFGLSLLFCVNDTELMKYLIKNGLDPNKKDNKGQTPLFYARNADIVNTLISLGTDIETKDNGGKTAIMVTKNEQAIIALIENGANIFVKHKNGMSDPTPEKWKIG